MPDDKKNDGNSHKGHRARLRQLAHAGGLENFSPHNVLELLLFNPIKQKNTNEIGHALIDHCGGFKEVFEADVEKLTEVEGVGAGTAVFLKSVYEVYSKYGGYRNAGNIYLDCPLILDAYYSKHFKRENGDQLAVTSVDSSLAALRTKVVKYATDEVSRPKMIRDIFSGPLNPNGADVILAQFSPKDGISESEIEAANSLIADMSRMLKIRQFVFIRNKGIELIATVERQ